MVGLVVAALTFLWTLDPTLARYGTFFWWWYLVTGVLCVLFSLLGCVGGKTSAKRAACLVIAVLHAVTATFGFFASNALLRGDLTVAAVELFLVLAFSIFIGFNKVSNKD